MKKVTKTVAHRPVRKSAAKAATEQGQEGTETGAETDGEESGTTDEGPYQSVLTGLFDGVTAAYEKGRAQRADLIERLDKLEAELAVLEGVLQIKSGGGRLPKAPRSERVPRDSVKAFAPGGGSGSGPRGEVPKSIHKLLEEAGADGLTRGEIMQKLQISSEDKTGSTSVSNFLSSQKKKGVIAQGQDKRYSLA